MLMPPRHFLLLVLALSPAAVSRAEPSQAPRSDAGTPRYETRKAHDPDGIGKVYMGRENAQVMGHLAAGWLDRPARDREGAPSKPMEGLKFKPGEDRADIGAG